MLSEPVFGDTEYQPALYHLIRIHIELPRLPALLDKKGRVRLREILPSLGVGQLKALPNERIGHFEPAGDLEVHGDELISLGGLQTVHPMKLDHPLRRDEDRMLHSGYDIRHDVQQYRGDRPELHDEHHEDQEDAEIHEQPNQTRNRDPHGTSPGFPDSRDIFAYELAQHVISFPLER